MLINKPLTPISLRCPGCDFSTPTLPVILACGCCVLFLRETLRALIVLKIVGPEAEGQQLADRLDDVGVVLVVHVDGHGGETEFPNELPAHAARAGGRADVSGHGQGTDLGHFWPLHRRLRECLH